MTPTVQYKTHSGNTYPARQTHMITSELGRLLHATGCDWTHLYKGCISKLGQSPGNLGLAASCGTYHEDVLGHNLLLQHQATYAKKNPEQICRADFRSRHYHLRQKMLVRINYAAHAGFKQSRYVVQVSEQIPNPTESYTCCHTSQESLCLPKLMSCFFSLRTAES